VDNLSNDLAAIDRLIHEPARLVILTALSACIKADFLFLQSLTGLTAGNLSTHLTRLEEVGLITIEKRIIRKRTNTEAQITPLGDLAIQKHWEQLEELRRRASSFDGR
jgi:DNA-binding transcriptional ArsR family regulator